MAAPMTRKQVRWLAERGLVPMKACEEEITANLREIVMHPTSWPDLVDEAGVQYRRGARPFKPGQTVTRVYGLPVVNFFPGGYLIR